MKAFNYIRPRTMTETQILLDQNRDGRVKPLAGGTDLLTLMKARINTPIELIDIKRLDGVKTGIRENNNGVSLGALTTLAEIEKSPLLQEKFTAISQAAGLAATPQLRNMATVGGNLLQRPRCWYFRNPHIDCWLKGGSDCPAREGENQFHALFGDSPCVAVHPSDLASALVAFDATVHLTNSDGKRTVPLVNFFALPDEERRSETVIGPDELITSIQVPSGADSSASGGTRSVYLKAMDRNVWAFALVGVAAVVQMEDDRVSAVRLALSGVAPIPWRATAAEESLVGQAASEENFLNAAIIALDEAKPLAHNEYKRPLARNLIRRALKIATDQA